MAAETRLRKRAKPSASANASARQERKPSEGPPLTIRVEVKGLPPLIGFASACALVQRGRAYEIFLSDSASSKCLARLLVHQEPLFEQLLGTSLDFYDGSVTWMAERGIEPAAIASELTNLENIPFPQAANLFRLFRAGTDAVLECYYASPRVIHLSQISKKRGSVKADPVCQVQMDLSLLIGLLRMVKQLKESSSETPPS